MKKNISEMKSALLQLISSHQFSGTDHEDPHTHLYTFYDFYGSVSRKQMWWYYFLGCFHSS